MMTINLTAHLHAQKYAGVLFNPKQWHIIRVRNQDGYTAIIQLPLSNGVQIDTVESLIEVLGSVVGVGTIIPCNGLFEGDSLWGLYLNEENEIYVMGQLDHRFIPFTINDKAI